VCAALLFIFPPTPERAFCTTAPNAAAEIVRGVVDSNVFSCARRPRIQAVPPCRLESLQQKGKKKKKKRNACRALAPSSAESVTESLQFTRNPLAHVRNSQIHPTPIPSPALLPLLPLPALPKSRAPRNPSAPFPRRRWR
jgi:hypothetical protein